MRDFNETEIGEALAFLCAAGKGYKLIGYDGNCGNTELFKIALVNYQP